MQPNTLNLLTQMQPVSKIEPISPTEMRTPFGGPLYQMLNPGTRKPRLSTICRVPGLSI